MGDFYRILPAIDLLVLTAEVGADTARQSSVPLESFDTSPLSAFPPHWQARQDEEIARQIHRGTEENGNHFLHAHAESRGVEVGFVKVFRAQDTPVLRWRWRVLQPILTKRTRTR